MYESLIYYLNLTLCVCKKYRKKHIMCYFEN